MAAAVLLSCMVLASAQVDTIRVGGPTVPHALTVGVDTVDNYVVQGGEERLVVTFVQRVSEVPEGYLVVQENRSPAGDLLSLDSLVVAQSTLATLWHGDVTPAGQRHVSFSGSRMTGVAIDTTGQETPIDEGIGSDRFDYSIFFLVLDQLPLSPGYEGVLATYDITRGPVDVAFSVVASESIDLGTSSYDAWKMEVDVGGQTVTRWVDPSTAKELRWSLTAGGREMIGRRRPG